MATLMQQRHKFQVLFKNVFQHFVNSSMLKNLLSTLSLSNFSFHIAGKDEKDEILNLTQNYGFVSDKASVFATLDLTMDEMKYIASEDLVGHFIETDRSIVIKDRRDQTVGFFSFTDFMDDYAHFGVIEANKVPGNTLPSKVCHVAELLNFGETYMIKSITKNGEVKFKYGDCGHAGMVVINPKYRNLGLPVVVRMFILYLMCNMNYKVSISFSVHDSMKKTVSRSSVTKFELVDFSDFVFDDGTKMDYYFKQFASKYGLNDKEMKDIRENCKFQIVVIQPPHMDAKMMEQVSVKYAQQFLNRNKLQSKL
eukprot:87915_1